MNKAMAEAGEKVYREWASSDDYRADQLVLAIFAAMLPHSPIQAQLDRLMLEHCPDEMTKEQVENWKRNQKIAPEQPPIFGPNECGFASDG